jgi:hypothetical protein
MKEKLKIYNPAVVTQGKNLFEEGKMTTMSMRKMMGCIMCLLLIGTNNSEEMCGLRQYDH